MTVLGRPVITEVRDRESERRSFVSSPIAIRRLPAGSSAPRPNEDAITRLVGAILPEQNEEWNVGRRYLKLESIAPVSDNLNLMLLAEAA